MKDGNYGARAPNRTEAGHRTPNRTDAAPGASGPLPGLISKSGIQRAALTALDPLSSQRLDGHVPLPESLLLERLRWASTAHLQPIG